MNFQQVMDTLVNALGEDTMFAVLKIDGQPSGPVALSDSILGERIRELQTARDAYRQEDPMWQVWEKRVTFASCLLDVCTAGVVLREKPYPDVAPPDMNCSDIEKMQRLRSFTAELLAASSTAAGFPVFSAGMDQTGDVEPGKVRRALMTTAEEISSIAQPFMEIAAAMHDNDHVDGLKLMCALAYACGRVMGMEGVAMNPEAPVKVVLPSLITGHEEASASIAAREGQETH